MPALAIKELPNDPKKVETNQQLMLCKKHAWHGSRYADGSTSLWFNGRRVGKVYGGTGALHDAVDVSATVSNDEEVVLRGDVQEHAHAKRLLLKNS